MNRSFEPRVLPVVRPMDGLPLLHSYFESAAARWPKNTAVEIPPGSERPQRRIVTYEELRWQAGQMAARLKGSISGEAVVAILLPRTSEWLYSSQLAVGQAGGAFTCMEPAFPDGQIREILEDSAAVAVITDAVGRQRLLEIGFDVGKIFEVRQELARNLDPVPLSNPPTWLTAHSLAYIIYTSGTTGRPKGVMIEHAGIAGLVGSDLVEFQLSPSDRVAQGSSSAYDSSIEESWLAFAAGAALVVMDDATARLGPDLIPWLRRERISVFCPPPTLLRATGCERPDLELPELRLLYVGGEALPRDVADRWSKGRRLENGYGPTECTVTALRTRVFPGDEITIGRPVPGLHAWVLGESLDELPDGQPGELCIGGVGLARGYRHRPALTAEKFPEHPVLGRIYRTGDLVCRRADGSFVYHGRIDAQVKLRGYRVELEAVESRLAECSGVREAACTVQGEGSRQILAAFVVPDGSVEPLSSAVLAAALGQILPSYMVPSRFYTVESLPRTVGGKVNRRALPLPAPDLRPAARPTEPPRSHLEEKIVAVWRQVFPSRTVISIDDDFFADLSGDSLTAAIAISLLRGDSMTASLTVRDVYEAKTVRELALRAGESAGAPRSSTAAFTGERTRRVGWPVFLQAVWVLKSLGVGSIVAYGGVFHLIPTLAEHLSPTGIVLLGPLLLLLALVILTLLSVVWAVGVKRVLIGRYEALRVPVWGSFYVRHWMVLQTIKLIPWWLIEGTEFQCMALRALGARIGQRVHLHRGVVLFNGGWDLLEIGDDVTLGQDVDLQLVELERGHLRVSPIYIGEGCTLEPHSGVGGRVRMGPGAYLTARSALAFGEQVPAGERWDGIPARPSGVAPAALSVPRGAFRLSPMGAAVWSVLARVGLYLFLALPFEVALWVWFRDSRVDDANDYAWFRSPTLHGASFLWLAAVSSAVVVGALVMEAVACRCLGRVQAGVLSLWSPAYVRLWLKAGLVDAAGRWLYGTLFWPIWLRAAGMKVGDDCEISGLIDAVPELIEIGAQTFCADGIYLGGPQIHRGVVSISPVSLGPKTFVGNGAVIRGGQQLPPEILIGICTVVDGAVIRPNTAWFGHPPFELPHREVIELDRRLTHSPSFVSYATRWFWEVLRFVIPAPLAYLSAVWYTFLSEAKGGGSPAVFVLLIVPIAGFAMVVCSTLWVVALKWVLLGRVRPGVHALWSCWASRWDFVCMAWSFYAIDAVSALEGTPFLNPLLRAAGVQLGRGVVLGGGFAHDLPDPDMLVIEDGATVDCTFQAHTFEDRVLKMDRVVIGSGATVGRNAVLLYGAQVGHRTGVAPHSVVMKQEHLLSGQSYSGFPTQPDPGCAWLPTQCPAGAAHPP